MQNLKILNSKEKKNILKVLKEQFNYKEKPDYVFLQNSNDRIYVIHRDMEKMDLKKLRIDSIGIYFATLMPEGIRLSIEGSQIVGKTAKKNILELNKEQFENWLKGADFDIETKLKNFVLVKYKGDFLGCGKVKDGKLLNYVPKARRLSVVNI
ncbi:MAG: hypothetical protein ABH828_04055 [archaeon]